MEAAVLYRAVAVLVAALAGASGPPSPPSLPFTDVTAASGVAFVHTNGAYGEKLLPETMGGGVAVLDYDRDGDPDLLFVDSADWPGHERPGAASSQAPTMALYANDGAGHFHDVTAQAGLDLSFYGQGVAVGDYDGDGWPDLYLTAVGPNHLLHNRGGRFAEVTAAAGVTGGPADWSTCAAFFDADGDGDLDLFVCNYLTWSPEIDRRLDRHGNTVPLVYGRPQHYRGADPILFRNDGSGAFTDVSAASGVRVHDPETGEPVAKALGLVPVDVDGDGRVDLLVADDTTRNLFFHNRGPEGGVPRFEEAAELFGVAYDGDGGTTGAMGTDAGELGAGGGLALAVGNFEGEATSLYRAGRDDPTFLPDLSLASGLAHATRGHLTFGVLLFDADLDGRLDLFQANGHVETDIARLEPGQRYAQPAQLFWNTGGKPLLLEVPAAELGDLSRPMAGRGAAFLDLEGDGDLDLVLTQPGGPARLLRNDLDPDPAAGHHHLRVVLRSPPPNPDGIGARVEATAGGSLQVRRIMPTRSYLSQVEPAASFGLGAAETVERLRITWPDGHVQEIRDLPADRSYLIERN